MTTSSSIALAAVLLALGLLLLLARLDKLESRLQLTESALQTLEPLSQLLSQVRPTQDVCQPVQATGAPNVSTEATDSALAWCPERENTGREWILLRYGEAILTTAIEVHANSNPGAVVHATAVEDDDSETELWSGPAQTEGAQRITQLRLAGPVNVKRLKLTLDTGAVPGWNEIDAVAIVSADGKKHWAVAAEASSSWQPSKPAVLPGN